MKYNQPAGKAEGAAYDDGNRSAGILGDIPPAAAIEHAQRELVHLITYSGQVPAAADLEQVRKAIEILIAAATGGGDPSQYVTMAQATSRLPIYPEVLASDGRIGVTTPAAGQIRVPNGATIMHRGIKPYTTVQQDIATAASKTYHLRWTPVGGFVLKDLADGAYNPSVLAETSAAFDSTYDDVLVARVVTSGINVATITNLANKSELRVVDELTGTVAVSPGENMAAFDFAKTHNFARTPQYLWSISQQFLDGPNPMTDRDIDITSAIRTRYGFSGRIMNDFVTTMKIQLLTVA